MNIVRKPEIELSYHNIVNTDRYNVWFAKNVAFVFSIGIGISDQYNSYLRKLQENIFNIKSNSQLILLNKITIVNYESLKDIEINAFGIYNGNYKLGLYVFVNEMADFSYAQETLYRKAGLVANYYNEDIFSYISSVILKYGLIRDLKMKECKYNVPPEKKESEEEITARMTRQNRDIIQKVIPMQMPAPKGRYLSSTSSNVDKVRPKNIFTETTGKTIGVIDIPRKPINPMPIVKNNDGFKGFSIFDCRVE